MYYYDLVSGKVNGVAYNPTGRDRYFHKYDYDADNRIKKTYTWEGADWKEIGYHDSTNWNMTDLPLSRLSLWPFDEDAVYEYYKHGSISRTELGHLKVQGLDYVYTIHGWIKAVNSDLLYLDIEPDPGRDGYGSGGPNRWVGLDGFGYVLKYYDGDYQSIGPVSQFIATENASGFGLGIVDMFNGNISSSSTSFITDLITTLPDALGYEYHYDQLNRLVGADAYRNLDPTSDPTGWHPETLSGDYQTRYQYDANGNILTLKRNGPGSIHLGMDSLTYHYISGTNKLDHVDDVVNSGNYSTDIDDQSAGNYDYDAIGNLIRDNAEGIANIEWTVYGKVKRVTRSSIAFGPDLEFAYGSNGQRIMKKAIYDHPGVLNDSTLTTLYVRDAGGNIMTVYREVENATVGNGFYIMEQDLYGSSRLGTREKVVDLNVPIVPDPDIEGVIYVERGYKKYELSNHLGNVLMVISDRREGMNCTMASNTYTYYEADILMATDYYPFGSTMPQREWSSTASVFGFNGKRKDEEGIGGGGTTYDYGFRIYNPGLGRFLSIDPLMKNYPWYTPYQFSGNKPIWAIDVDGLEEELYIREIYRNLWTPRIFVHGEYRIKLKVINMSSSAMSQSEIKKLIDAEKEKIKTAVTPSIGDVFWTPEMTDVFGCWDDVSQKYAISFSITTMIEIEYTTIENVMKDDLVVIIVDEVNDSKDNETLGKVNAVGGNIAVVEASTLGKKNTFVHEVLHLLGFEHTDAKNQLMSNKPYDNYSYVVSGENKNRNLMNYLYNFWYSGSWTLPRTVKNESAPKPNDIKKDIRNFIDENTKKR